MSAPCRKRLARRDRRATVALVTEIATKIETLEDVGAGLNANVEAIRGAVDKLHVLYELKIKKLKGEIETARNERDKAQGSRDAIADAFADLLPGEIDTCNRSELDARIEEVFEVFNDVRVVVKTVEQLLGGYSDEDSTETTELRARVCRLADRLW